MALIKKALAHNFSIIYKTGTQLQHFLLFLQVSTLEPYCFFNITCVCVCMCLKKERISHQKTQKQTEQKFYGNLRSVAKSKTMAFRHTVESSVSNLVLLCVYNFLASLCFEGMMMCSY